MFHASVIHSFAVSREPICTRNEKRFDDEFLVLFIFVAPRYVA